jgi:deoxyhypusine synthase
MNRQGNSLTIHPPISSKLLGRYRHKKGVYVIRIKDQVIYVGNSVNIYKSGLRLFQKGGVLSHLPVQKVTFEILLTTMRLASVEMVLKRHFKPQYNYISKLPIHQSTYEKKQVERIKNTYLSQSRFATQGASQSNS